jgi:hypothetical protein
MAAVPSEGGVFEICLLIGNPMDFETMITANVYEMIQLRSNGRRVGITHKWELFGFRSQMDFDAAMHRTDLVIVNAAEMDDPVSRGWLSGLLESVGAMGVIVGLVDCLYQTLEDVCREPAVLWLEGHVVVLTCMPGGVAISYRLGGGRAEAGRRIAEVLKEAGMGGVAFGAGVYGGPGRVIAPGVPEAFILLAERGIELNSQAFDGADYLVGASLAKSGLREIPFECFGDCPGLTLVLSPPELKVLDLCSFDGCLALVQAEVPGVETVYPRGVLEMPCAAKSRGWRSAGEGGTVWI